MTDLQLYLAIGIPTLAVLAGILTNAMQMNGMNARMNSLDTRFSSLDTRFNSFDTRFSSLETRVDGRFSSLEQRIDRRFNDLDVKFDTLTGKVVEVDNRVTRIEAKLGIS